MKSRYRREIEGSITIGENGIIISESQIADHMDNYGYKQKSALESYVREPNEKDEEDIR